LKLLEHGIEFTVMTEEIMDINDVTVLTKMPSRIY